MMSFSILRQIEKNMRSFLVLNTSENSLENGAFAPKEGGNDILKILLIFPIYV